MTYAPDLVSIARVAFGNGRLASPDRTAHAANPLCGDEIEIDLTLEDERIRELAHRTKGCTFTIASASLLAQAVRGRTPAEARELALTLKRQLATGNALPQAIELLTAVRAYPARFRCALLPWDALLDALRDT